MRDVAEGTPGAARLLFTRCCYSRGGDHCDAFLERKQSAKNYILLATAR